MKVKILSVALLVLLSACSENTPKETYYGESAGRQTAINIIAELPNGCVLQTYEVSYPNSESTAYHGNLLECPHGKTTSLTHTDGKTTTNSTLLVTDEDIKKRIEKAKNEALGKLTQEERVLLGL